MGLLHWILTIHLPLVSHVSGLADGSQGLTLGRMLRIPGSALWNSNQATWQHAPMAMTVLIVDDHATFRSLARDLLESEGFEVIGEAESGTSAIERAAALRPDLVLLDVQLPDLTGFEVIERLRA